MCLKRCPLSISIRSVSSRTLQLSEVVSEFLIIRAESILHLLWTKQTPLAIDSVSSQAQLSYIKTSPNFFLNKTEKAHEHFLSKPTYSCFEQEIFRTFIFLVPKNTRISSRVRSEKRNWISCQSEWKKRSSSATDSAVKSWNGESEQVLQAAKDKRKTHTKSISFVVAQQ